MDFDKLVKQLNNMKMVEFEAFCSTFQRQYFKRSMHFLFYNDFRIMTFFLIKETEDKFCCKRQLKDDVIWTFKYFQVSKRSYSTCYNNDYETILICVNGAAQEVEVSRGSTKKMYPIFLFEEFWKMLEKNIETNKEDLKMDYNINEICEIIAEDLVKEGRYLNIIKQLKDLHVNDNRMIEVVQLILLNLFDKN